MDRPYQRRLAVPGMSQGEDRLLGMIVALTSQVAAMRERIDTLEVLLEASGMLDADSVEHFEPNENDAERRDGLRADLIARVMHPLRDAAAREAEQARKGSPHD